jgi:cysteinyl-tRNA synthetase
VLFDLVRLINQARDGGASDEQLKKAQASLRELGEVLGLRLQRSEKAVDAAPFVALAKDLQKEIVVDGIAAHLAAAQDRDAAGIIAALLQARVELRAQKQWKLSDAIRDRLAALGVQVEDSAGGSSWRWG